MGASEGYIRHVHEGPGGVEGSPGGRRASAEGLFRVSMLGGEMFGGHGCYLSLASQRIFDRLAPMLLRYQHNAQLAARFHAHPCFVARVSQR